MTLMGKAVIVNTLLVAGLNHLGSVMACPDHWVQRITKLIMEFYWTSKPAKLKKDTITAPREMGGTGLINAQYKLWF